MATGLNLTAAEDDGDLGLVRQARAGDLEAFEALVRRHERHVFFLARRIVQNDADAEDVTQETFLSAVEHLGGFREEARFSTWLLRIATHAALKVLRRRRGKEWVPVDTVADGGDSYAGVPHPELIAEWTQTPEHLAQQNETRALIEQALGELDEKHRLVFLLRDVEGLSVRETAEALGLSEGNVKVRLLRARLQLRERLTAAFGDRARRLPPHDHGREG